MRLQHVDLPHHHAEQQIPFRVLRQRIFRRRAFRQRRHVGEPAELHQHREPVREPAARLVELQSGTHRRGRDGYTAPAALGGEVEGGADQRLIEFFVVHF